MARIRSIKPEYKKRPIPSSVRRAVARAAGGVLGQRIAAACAYCDAPGWIFWPTNSKSWPVFDGLELDHVTPEFRGGKSDAENIALACRSCNRRKGAK